MAGHILSACLISDIRQEVLGRGQVAGCAGAGIGRRGGSLQAVGSRHGIAGVRHAAVPGGHSRRGSGRAEFARCPGRTERGWLRSPKCIMPRTSAVGVHSSQTCSMASCSSKKKEAPARSLGRGVRRLHEPCPEQGNVRAHIRDGKPEWRQGHSVPKKGLGTPSYG